jgi:hypothetical protein
MKKYFFLVFLFICNFSFSQSIYYDAVELSKYIVPGSNPVKFVVPIAGDPNEAAQKAMMKRYCEIINKYYGNKFATDKQVHIGISLGSPDENPFLAPFMSPNTVLAIGTNPVTLSKQLFSTASSIGGLNVSNFADGLAKFLVERTKQELSITFFEKFKEQLNASDELKILFPATLKVLTTVGNEIYLFDAYINTLREAFIKDMMNFYEDVQQLKKIPVYQLYFNQHPELYTLIATSFYLIDQYSKGVHPGKVLADFDTLKVNFKQEALQTNLRNSIAVAQLFSESLRSNDPDRYWISEESLNVLWKDSVLLDIYFGLIYPKGKPIKFVNDSQAKISFQSILYKLKTTTNVFEDSIQPYQAFIRTLHADAEEVQEYVKTLKQKSKEEKNYNDYYTLYNASLDLIEDGFDFIDLPYVDLGEKEKQIADASGNWIFVARSTGELYIDIRTKNYSSATLNTVTILDRIFPDNIVVAELTGGLSKYNKQIDNFLKSGSLFSAEKVKAFIHDDLKELNNKNIDTITVFIFNKTTYHFRKAILKYGTFAAAIAQAQNSEEVKAAIESIALPVGSSSIKRNTNFNISLNAFVGLYAAEEARDSKNASNHHVNYWRFSAGIAAPIGLAFSWGGLKCKDKRTNGKTVGGKSIGFFVPLIDVGAVTAMRFKDSTANISPEIKLQNIFAPGFYLHYGFGKCPVSLLIGGQISPSLRTATVQNVTVDNQLYTRIGATLTVDIPILNLYTKTDSIRKNKK